MAGNQPPATVDDLLASVKTVVSHIEQHRKAMADVAAQVKAAPTPEASAKETAK